MFKLTKEQLVALKSLKTIKNPRYSGGWPYHEWNWLVNNGLMKHGVVLDKNEIGYIRFTGWTTEDCYLACLTKKGELAIKINEAINGSG